jgi:hypothetical protein
MNAKLRPLRIAMVATLMAGAGLCTEAQSQPAPEFYRGKTITILVGFGPGGGYDAYAQLLSLHMPRHIPGDPTVIVKHMPGGGSLVLMNHLYNVAPRDGTVFGIPAGNAAFSPLIGSVQEKAAVRFDAVQMNWLGSLERFTPIGIAWHTTGFKTLQDVRARELQFGSSGPASGGEIYSKLLNEMLGTKLKPIRGYKGSNDITLAMERGEIDGFVGWCWTCMKADRPQYLADRLVNLFVQIGLEPDPEMAETPSVLELIKDPKDHQVARLVLANLAMSRPFVAPPELPSDRVKTLRDAFEATARDPLFVAAARRSGRQVDLFGGDLINRLLRESYALPADIIDRASELSLPN